MRFLSFVVANVVGRPVRSLLTVVGVSVAVTAVVSLLGIVRGFERSLLDLYEQRGIDLLVYQAGKVQLMASVLPESLGERIATIPNVSEASPVLSEVLSLLDGDLVGVTVQGWNPSSSMVHDLKIISGRPLEPTDHHAIMLGESLASATGKQVGDAIELLENEPFTVVGIYQSYNVFDNGSAVTRLGDLQEIMLREKDVTLFAIVAQKHDAASLEQLQRDIQAIDAKLEVKAAREMAENSAEIRMVRSFAWVTSAIALLIGSIGMLNTMMMAVFERTKEIAMLRALGWRRRRIVTLILGEATLLSIGGAIVGIVASIGIIRLLSMFPAAGRVVSANLSLDVMAQGFTIAVLLGFCGGLFPAWKASRLLPVEGLRHD